MESGDYYIVLIGLYLSACIIVAIVAGRRGWALMAVFFVCLFASPLIGAILYSTYKKIELPIE